MTSLLFKCIPCTRRGKLSISNDTYRTNAVQYALAPEPIERQLAHAHVQSNAQISHARGFEDVAMGTVDHDNGIQSDTKK